MLKFHSFYRLEKLLCCYAGTLLLLSLLLLLLLLNALVIGPHMPCMLLLLLLLLLLNALVIGPHMPCMGLVFDVLIKSSPKYFLALDIILLSETAAKVRRLSSEKVSFILPSFVGCMTKGSNLDK